MKMWSFLLLLLKVVLSLQKIDPDKRLVKSEDDIYLAIDNLTKAQEELRILQKEIKNQNEDLERKMSELEANHEGLKRDFSFVEDPLYFHACGAHTTVFTNHEEVIPYQKLLIHSTNIAGSSLDKDTGVFTNAHPGAYTVTWSLYSHDEAGDHLLGVYLRKNGKVMEESRHWSYYTGPSGHVKDQGGRTLIISLDEGETLDLFCSNCDAGVDDVTFCVSLTTPNI